MGSSFRDNLRNELNSQGIIVKELSARTKIPVTTLNCYLRSQSTEPSAENAVKIARALRVSVEYLVLDEDAGCKQSPASRRRELQEIMRMIEKLNADQCRAVARLIKAFER